METRKRSGCFKEVLLTVVVFLQFTVCASSAVVDDIQISFLQGRWYHGAGTYFQPTGLQNQMYPAPITLGQISLEGIGSYDYQFSGTLALTQCALIEDQTPPGGLTKGLFAGGATLTITGDLWLKSNPAILIVDDGDILVAQMDTAPWFLTELLHPPALLNTVRGQADFVPTGGALKVGFGDETLEMGDFRGDFTFAMSTPTVDGFGSTSYYCTSPKLQLTAIPEPASLFLFSVAAITILNTKRKTYSQF